MRALALLSALENSASGCYKENDLMERTADLQQNDMKKWFMLAHKQN